MTSDAGRAGTRFRLLPRRRGPSRPGRSLGRGPLGGPWGQGGCRRFISPTRVRGQGPEATGVPLAAQGRAGRKREVESLAPPAVSSPALHTSSRRRFTEPTQPQPPLCQRGSADRRIARRGTVKRPHWPLIKPAVSRAGLVDSHSRPGSQQQRSGDRSGRLYPARRLRARFRARLRARFRARFCAEQTGDASCRAASRQPRRTCHGQTQLQLQ